MTAMTLRPRLVGERVVLRAPVASDVDDRLALGRDPEIVKMFGGDPINIAPLTRQMAQNWVNDQIDLETAWIIEIAGRCVGDIRLHSVNQIDARAVLGLGILDPTLLGQGYGTEAITLLLQHAFGALGLHRVSLRVIEFNSRAIAAYKKVGFKEEGRERQSALVQGERYDDLIMGVLAHEFHSLEASS